MATLEGGVSLVVRQDIAPVPGQRPLQYLRVGGSAGRVTRDATQHPYLHVAIDENFEIGQSAHTLVHQQEMTLHDRHVHRTELRRRVTARECARPTYRMGDRLASLQRFELRNQAIPVDRVRTVCRACSVSLRL